jgi:hypothetical protein
MVLSTRVFPLGKRPHLIHHGSPRTETTAWAKTWQRKLDKEDNTTLHTDDLHLLASHRKEGKQKEGSRGETEGQDREGISQNKGEGKGGARNQETTG